MPSASKVGQLQVPALVLEKNKNFFFCLLQALGMPQEAILCYQRALQTRPNFAVALGEFFCIMYLKLYSCILEFVNYSHYLTNRLCYDGGVMQKFFFFFFFFCLQFCYICDFILASIPFLYPHVWLSYQVLDVAWCSDKHTLMCDNMVLHSDK